jgi:hypothetical protein
VDETWAPYLDDALEHWPRLGAAAQGQLFDIARILMAEKHWEGCGGLALTDEMRLSIAVQAGTLLIGLEHDYYRYVQSILVYPGTYEIPRHDQTGTLAPTKRAVLGHAQLRGPVVLSWKSARRRPTLAIARFVSHLTSGFAWNTEPCPSVTSMCPLPAKGNIKFVRSGHPPKLRHCCGLHSGVSSRGS